LPARLHVECVVLTSLQHRRGESALLTGGTVCFLAIEPDFRRSGELHRQRRGELIRQHDAHAGTHRWTAHPAVDVARRTIQAVAVAVATVAKATVSEA